MRGYTGPETQFLHKEGCPNQMQWIGRGVWLTQSGHCSHCHERIAEPSEVYLRQVAETEKARASKERFAKNQEALNR